MKFVRTIFIETYGKSAYNKLLDSDDNRIYVRIKTDTTGRIISIDESHFFGKGLLNLDKKDLIKKISKTEDKLCIYNSETEIGYKDYLRINNYNPSYDILLKPKLIDARLNN